MEVQYDENLALNPFLKRLKLVHPEVIEAASIQKLIIAVPRLGSIPEPIQDEHLLSHILVPNSELPETHFNTETGEVTVQQRKLLYTDKNGANLEVGILFEEVFYTKDFAKYKVWCIERPLVACKTFGTLCQVTSLSEAVSLIWTEVSSSHSKHALRKIDASINNFRKNNCGNRCTDLEKLKNNTHLLYNHCLDILLMNRNLKEKCKADPFLLKNLKLAVETYMTNALYSHLFELITTFTVEESEKLNLAIRNLSDVQLGEFKVDAKLHEFVPAMKLELAKVDSVTTVLDKLTCLKRALNVIAERYNKKNNSAKVLTTDDVIPALIFVIIKSGLPFWMTNLTFLKEFSFTEFVCGNEYGAENFLIATLEAAVTFIVQNSDLHRKHCEARVGQRASFRPKFVSKEEYLSYLFSMIQCEDSDEVSRLLNGASLTSDDALFDVPELCHPLCSCQECRAKLADCSPDINSASKQGCSALFVAVKFGLPKMVSLLLSKDANVNVEDAAGWTPLHHAAAKGYQNILLLLLHAGAKINKVNRDHNSPLLLACLHGHVNCGKALLYFAEHMKTRLEIDLRNKQGDTALHVASKWGFLDMVQTLLENNARVDVPNKFGLTATQLAHNSLVREVLQKHWELPRGTQNVCISESDLMDNERPRDSLLNRIEKVDKVMQAIALGDSKLAFYLLGIQEKHKGCHPLCACEECLKNKNGVSSDVVDVNDQDTLGNTALHQAASFGNQKLVKTLLESGADIFKTNHLRQTPLHLACRAERSQLVRVMLSSSCVDSILNVRDSNGDTALIYASRTGDSKLVEMLLKFSPDLEMRNSAGQTALDVARESIFPTATRMLEAALERKRESEGDNANISNTD